VDLAGLLLVTAGGLAATAAMALRVRLLAAEAGPAAMRATADLAQVGVGAMDPAVLAGVPAAALKTPAAPPLLAGVLVFWARAPLDLEEPPLELGAVLADLAELTGSASAAHTEAVRQAAHLALMAAALSESSGAQVARSHQQTLEISKWPR